MCAPSTRLVLFVITFDDTARLLVVSWVLFESESKTTTAKRLLCGLSTVAAWSKAYKDTG